MMEQMQFCSIIVLVLLTATLVLLSHQVDQYPVLNHSRWMMASSTAILCTQFLLQYVLCLREVSPTAAVMLNLTLFIPSSWLFNVAAINVERHGKLKLGHRLTGLLSWLLVLMLLGLSVLMSGGSPLADTPIIRTAEALSALIYIGMQAYYIYCNYVELHHLRRSLNDYYDHDVSELLRWMMRSVMLLTLMVGMAPLAIFNSGLFLAAFGILIIAGVYYWVITFVCYAVSNDARKVLQAQKNEDEAGLDIDDEKSDADANRLDEIDLVVKKWLSTDSYLKSGITIAMAAREMNISQRNFRSWFHAKGYESYSYWLQTHRVNRAKQLIIEHPDWTMETIASCCGFSSRAYMHHLFQKYTGQTPAEYVKEQGINKKAPIE